MGHCYTYTDTHRTHFTKMELTKSIHDEFSCFICLELTINKELGKTKCCKQYICKNCFNQQKTRENKCAHCRNSENYRFENLQSLSSSLYNIEQKIVEQVKNSDWIVNSIIENHEQEMDSAQNEINEMKSLNYQLKRRIQYLEDNKNSSSTSNSLSLDQRSLSFDEAYYINETDVPGHSVANTAVGQFQEAAYFKYKISEMLKSLK